MSVLSEYIGAIRVKKTPDGEAPEDILREWIGVEIPCLYLEENDIHSAGVESGKQAPSRKRYVVSQEEAIDALEQKSRRAARWWREQGFPNSKGAQFFFEASQVVETKHVALEQDFMAMISRIRRLTLE